MSNICFRSLLLALHILTLIDAAIVDGPPAGVERPAVTAQRLMQIAWAAESSSVAIDSTQPITDICQAVKHELTRGFVPCWGCKTSGTLWPATVE